MGEEPKVNGSVAPAPSTRASADVSSRDPDAFAEPLPPPDARDTQPPSGFHFAPVINVVNQNSSSNQNLNHNSAMANAMAFGGGIVIAPQRASVPFVLRALWFVCVGWWLSAVFIVVGYLCCITIVLAPLGFWFLNRIPQAQTLRLRSTEYQLSHRNGITHVVEARKKQLPWYVRAVYFPFGLLIGLIWLVAAWIVSLPIITLPLSIWMIDRAPTVITLQQH